MADSEYLEHRSTLAYVGVKSIELGDFNVAVGIAFTRQPFSFFTSLLL